MDQEDSDRNGFHYFVAALEILSMDATAQCEIMGNYNTPWEIRNGATAMDYGLADSLVLALKPEQKAAIQDLSEMLRSLPDAAIAPDGMDMLTPEGCVAGMTHAAWSPLRQKAAKLLELLVPAILENNRFFGS